VKCDLPNDNFVFPPGMEKVIKLIDDLVAELKQDQINDDNKKEYCAVQFDLSDDKKNGLGEVHF